ncbi:hypothetical protein L596_007873 [Steinernema carpocapsae]|uniref:Uncharacterized protein n=1 Tax=Steinernema carpocapsae TaxID=34508 RepID=A0A4U5PAT4_STECR|nr:hypothetical protein L596_007873 [Steinernema carpocapsae]
MDDVGVPSDDVLPCFSWSLQELGSVPYPTNCRSWTTATFVEEANKFVDGFGKAPILDSRRLDDSFGLDLNGDLENRTEEPPPGKDFQTILRYIQSALITEMSLKKVLQGARVIGLSEVFSLLSLTPLRPRHSYDVIVQRVNEILFFNSKNSTVFESCSICEDESESKESRWLRNLVAAVTWKPESAALVEENEGEEIDREEEKSDHGDVEKVAETRFFSIQTVQIQHGKQKIETLCSASTPPFVDSFHSNLEIEFHSAKNAGDHRVGNLPEAPLKELFANLADSYICVHRRGRIEDVHFTPESHYPRSVEFKKRVCLNFLVRLISVLREWFREHPNNTTLKITRRPFKGFLDFAPFEDEPILSAGFAAQLNQFPNASDL